MKKILGYFFMLVPLVTFFVMLTLMTNIEKSFIIFNSIIFIIGGLVLTVKGHDMVLVLSYFLISVPLIIFSAILTLITSVEVFFVVFGIVVFIIGSYALIIKGCKMIQNYNIHKLYKSARKH